MAFSFMKQFVSGVLILLIISISPAFGAHSPTFEKEARALTTQLVLYTDTHTTITPLDLIEAVQNYQAVNTSRRLLLQHVEDQLMAYYYPQETDPTATHGSSFHQTDLRHYQDITHYTVAGPEIKSPDGTVSKRDSDVWLVVLDVFPPVYLKQIHGFHVFHDKESSEVASLYPSQDQEGWELVVNKERFYPDGTSDLSQGIFSLTHELGHAISLGTTQFQTTDRCTTYEIKEGCLGPKAYLTLFIDRFRPERLLEFNGSPKELADAYPDSFLTTYAATNPVEDMAESFAVYVEESIPTTSTVIDQKLQFFDQFLEFREARAYIRQKRHR